MSDIEESIKKKFDNDLGVLENGGKIGVDPKIRNLVKENPYFWQSFMCFGVNMYDKGKIIVDVWTLCSPSVSSIALLKSMIKEYVIVKYYITKNIYHLTFVVQASQSMSENTEFKIQEYKWSWESESGWPE